MATKEVRGGQLKVLNRDQMRDVHYATLDVLQHTGVIVHSGEALKVLDEAGADIDYKKERAWVPQHLVEEAIRKTPHGFKLCGRNPLKYCKFEGNRVYFSTAGGPPNVLDLNGKRRPATTKDFEKLVRLTDALENIDIAGAGISGMVDEFGLPEAVQRARNILRRLSNTDKPGGVGAGLGKDQAIDSIKLGCVVMGDLKKLRRNPMGWCHVNPVSPLMLSKELIESAIVYARHGLPIHFGSEVLGSATGPATLAGILVQLNAENLSGVVVAQFAASPEHRPPILYGCISGILDLRTGVPALGSPEAGLLNAASTQMAKYYGMASRGSGGYTESKIPDAQAGYESMMTLITVALAGTNFIYASGGLEPGVLSISYEKYVLDNDMIGMVRRIMDGFCVTDETLAADTIDEVGPGGHYLAQEHTRKFFTKEYYFPTIFDRNNYERWVQSGSKDIRKAARNRAQKILEEHQPEPIDKDVEKDLQKIVKQIEKREIKTLN
jgi:trimethylamine--corrinoid protein Co-methyltransferase